MSKESAHCEDSSYPALQSDCGSQRKKWNLRRKRTACPMLLTEADLNAVADYDSEEDIDWAPDAGGRCSEAGSQVRSHFELLCQEPTTLCSNHSTPRDGLGGMKCANSPESVASSKTSEGKSSTEKMQELFICSVCLGETSEDSNEIVQCDNCGITVHEGCYGVDGESESVISSASDNSTEPWFCDPCKAGVVPCCELCPTLDGIFKETDAGQWVHVVCALYVSGVAFEDVERLRPVTLTEMPYVKYGAKVTSGIVASVMQNLKVVLGIYELTAPEECGEPMMSNLLERSDRTEVTLERSRYVGACIHGADDELKVGIEFYARIDAKLSMYRARFEQTRLTKPNPWVPREKLPRPLTSSAKVLRAMLNKAELVGMSVIVVPTEMAEAGPGEGRRKLSRQPALTADFVAFYLGNIFFSFRQLLRTLEFLRPLNCKLQREGRVLWNLLGNVSGQEPHEHPPTHLLHPHYCCSCAICGKSRDQHLLTECNTCQKHYHLGCLDPPLTRMPRKSKTSYWQCSECDRSGSDSSEGDGAGEAAPEGSKRSRRQVREPVKFTPQSDSASEDRKVGSSFQMSHRLKPRVRASRQTVVKRMKSDGALPKCAACQQFGTAESMVRWVADDLIIL
uniref:PHD finger protein 14 n=1 Tax=Eptatretus burgeri TaxID=7764 RepID=A0A8C4NJS7_EPTBU